MGASQALARLSARLSPATHAIAFLTANDLASGDWAPKYFPVTTNYIFDESIAGGGGSIIAVDGLDPTGLVTGVERTFTRDPRDNGVGTFLFNHAAASVAATHRIYLPAAIAAGTAQLALGVGDSVTFLWTGLFWTTKARAS